MFHTQLRTLLSTVALLAFTLSAIAQKSGNTFAKITVGPVYDAPKKHSYYMGAVGNERSVTQVLQSPDEMLTFQKFSANMQPAGNHAVNIDESIGHSLYEQDKIVAVGDRSYWFYTYFDKKAEMDFLYCRELDLESGNFKGEPRLIAKSGSFRLRMGLYKMVLKNIHVAWEVAVSPDGSMVLVAIDEWDKDVTWYHAAAVNILVFDANMSPLWNRTLGLPKDAEGTIVKGMGTTSFAAPKGALWYSFTVDNAGQAYGVRLVPDAEKGGKQDVNYTMQIARWTGAEGKRILFDYRPEGFFITDFKLVVDKAQQVTLIGLCSGNKKSSVRMDQNSVGAVLALSLKESGGNLVVQYQGLYPFTTDLLSAYENNRLKNKIGRVEGRGKSIEIGGLSIDEVHVGTDGALTVLMQQVLLTTTTITSSGSMLSGSSVTTYTYNDIFALRLSPEGTLAWMHKIPVRSAPVKTFIRKGDDETARYKALCKNGALYLLYMDDEDNKNLSAETEPKSYKSNTSGDLVAVKISPEGTLQKQILLNTKSDRLKIAPSAMKVLAGGSGLAGRARMKDGENRVVVVGFE